ncbi:MAG: hypothetical protein O2820_08155 [Planctomycetota bacterium]|nr:hypothetical protein [Planctomycetota bacterium]MDA1249184.1 hypothetical protein [Planctomycetota bacterium]
MSQIEAGVAILPAAGDIGPPRVADSSVPLFDPADSIDSGEPATTEPPNSPWYAQPLLVSCSVSTVVHAAMLAVCGLIWFLIPHGPVGAGVDSQLLESAIVEPPEPVELTEVATQPVSADVELTSGGESRAHLVQPAPELDVSPRDRTFLTTAATHSEWTGTDITQTIDLVGSALANIASDGNGNGTGDGDGDGTGGMFGLRPVGRRFVYVLDCSKSMNHPHNSEAKTRFKRMQIELVNSVKSMSAEQEFYFIFFNDYVIRMPSRSLTLATHDHKVKYLTWMAHLQADGNTEPKGALHLAMSLQPDVIYFLTDGTFDYRIEQELLEFPQTRAAVHTFAFKEHLTDEMREVYSLFDTNDGPKARKLVTLTEFRKTRAVWRSHQLLKKLAAKHNGQFRIIP